MNRFIKTVALAVPFIAVAAIVVLAVPTSHAAESESRAYLHHYNLPSTGIALEGYCPVAYFAVNKPVKGKAEFASTYNGVTYHFVNAAAKKAFDQSPKQYLPAFGGWCATGMAVGDKFPIDPRNFMIVNGRLMLFLKNKNIDALEIWNNNDEKEFTRKADAHWAKVTK